MHLWKDVKTQMSNINERIWELDLTAFEDRHVREQDIA